MGRWGIPHHSCLAQTIDDGRDRRERQCEEEESEVSESQ
jgi:hypothetical protein